MSVGVCVGDLRNSPEDRLAGEIKARKPIEGH